LKIVPGGTQPSADKWAAPTTRTTELRRLQASHCMSDLAGGNPFGDFEAPRRPAE
jgi:hypothetical protein